MKSKGLTIGSLFKLNLIGYVLSSLVVYFIVFMYAVWSPGSIVIEGIKVNGIPFAEPVNWFVHLIVIIPLSALISVVSTLVLFSGQWIYTRFRPLKLILKPVNENSET